MLRNESKDLGISRHIVETDDSMWCHLLHVLNRPWFRRIWILEEVGVAKAATFYYGWEAIDRNTLYRACCVLATRILALPALTALETHFARIRSLEKDFRFDLRKSFLTISKFDLLDSARCCAATDPRDMIYALMSHPTFSTDNDNDFLPIDYSHSRERVYTELALTLLLEPWNPLQLLSLVKHTEGQGLGCSQLPSWVPAWDIKSPVKTLGQRKPTFDACRSLQQAFTSSIDGICIQGYQVDTIEWQSRTLQSTDIPEARGNTTMSTNFKSIIDAFISLAIKLGNTHLRSCARTLVAADFYPHCPFTSFSGEDQSQDTGVMLDFVEYVDALLKGEVTRGAGVTSMTSFREILAKDCPHHWILKGMKDRFKNMYFNGPLNFSLKARQWCTGRRFFITAKGRFGLGPPVSQVGDPVYILAGAAVPFVLRRCFSNASSNFHDVQLRGECYVDGIMSGESDLILAEGETYLEKLRTI